MTEVNERRLSVGVSSGASTDAASKSLPASGQACPQSDCLVVSPAGRKFCWRCGYNFLTGTVTPRETTGRAKKNRRVHLRAAESPLIPVALATGMPEIKREVAHIPAPKPLPLPESAMPTAVPPELLAVTAEQKKTIDFTIPPAVTAQHAPHEVPEVPEVPKVAEVPQSSEVLEIPESTSAISESSATDSTELAESPQSEYPCLLMQTTAEQRSDSLTSALADTRPVKFILNGEAHFCGRKFKNDICLFAADLATSGFHGMFQRRKDGSFMFRDCSSNGTRLNGREIPKNIDTPLKNGDVLTLGSWTQITYFENTSQPEDLTDEADQVAKAAI